MKRFARGLVAMVAVSVVTLYCCSWSVGAERFDSADLARTGFAMGQAHATCRLPTEAGESAKLRDRVLAVNGIIAEWNANSGSPVLLVPLDESASYQEVLAGVRDRYVGIRGMMKSSRLEGARMAAVSVLDAGFLIGRAEALAVDGRHPEEAGIALQLAAAKLGSTDARAIGGLSQVAEMLASDAMQLRQLGAVLSAQPDRSSYVVAATRSIGANLEAYQELVEASLSGLPVTPVYQQDETASQLVER